MCASGYVFVGKHLPVEECVSKCVQLSEGLLGVNHQSVSGNDSLGVAVHHRNEGIRGGFGADPHSRKILLQQVAGGKIIRGEMFLKIYAPCKNKSTVDKGLFGMMK